MPTETTHVRYRLRGKRGTWEEAFSTLDKAVAHRDYLRKVKWGDKTVKVFKVTEHWEEIE